MDDMCQIMISSTGMNKVICTFSILSSIASDYDNFLITGFGAVVLLPFVWHSLPDLFSSGGPGLYVLIVAAVVLLLAALLEFEALRRGKLAVVEPIWSFEIPAAALLPF
jgi:phosphoglycerol transferase MdoB-like AlkP superfamily enzyme